MGFRFINAVVLNGPPETVTQILQTGRPPSAGTFEGEFSFLPFVYALPAAEAELIAYPNSLHFDTITTSQQNTHQEILTVKFGSEGLAVDLVLALVNWLDQSRLIYYLEFSYRQSDKEWTDVIQARNIH